MGDTHQRIARGEYVRRFMNVTVRVAYSGPAKQELCGCQELEDPKDGCKEAWDLLETRHGNKRTYIQHLIKGVCGGPSVRINDTKDLHLFTNALNACMRNLKVMEELK
ncbi:hypothetical protein E2C01_045797 [Portunus trituberculatus]|uniref:Uncharacterized protein n=1 Tax=Portunus trituberculatus TaxID=210409 RepID=A0A5B7G2Z2_PORTR|nr:hypothetical protein [Portunus trituberculatus]